jgi:DNA-binding transcriptional LysR family regulator
MDLRQLKTLLAVAECGTFSKAAEAVHLTPSAVSQQMNALETEVGVPLFDRASRRSTTLNTHGMQMVEAAQKLLQTAEEAIDAISGRRPVGTLNVGSVRTSAFSLLPRAIVAMQARYPDLRIKLRTGLTEAFLADVAARRLDVAVVAEHVAVPRELRWSPFIREPLLVIAPPETPQGSGRKLLESLPFIRFRSAVPLAYLIDTELARQGVRLNEIAEIDTIAAIVPCVKAGLGAAIVPDIAIQGAGSETLVTAAFGEPQVHRQMGLVERARNPSAAIVADLHDKLAELSGLYGVKRIERDPGGRVPGRTGRKRA